MIVKIRTTISLFEDEYNDTPILREVVKTEISPEASDVPTYRAKGVLDEWSVFCKLGEHYEKLKVVWNAIRTIF